MKNLRDLQITFEDHFEKRLNEFLRLINNNINFQIFNKYSLNFFARYVSIDDFRTPAYKKETDELLLDAFSQIKTETSESFSTTLMLLYL
jgi:hypothetical protein